MTLLDAIGRLQDLIGRAQHQAGNDRDHDRYAHLSATLQEAFDLCVDVRSKRPLRERPSPPPKAECECGGKESPDALRTAAIEFINDWLKGDFQLCKLAALDAECIRQALTKEAVDAS